MSEIEEKIKTMQRYRLSDSEHEVVVGSAYLFDAGQKMNVDIEVIDPDLFQLVILKAAVDSRHGIECGFRIDKEDLPVIKGAGPIPPPKSAIWDAIKKERGYQDAKHGRPQDAEWSPMEWAAIMMQELGEVANAYFHGGDAHRHMMQEILQVVSVGVAAMEAHGVYERMASNEKVNVGGSDHGRR